MIRRLIFLVLLTLLAAPAMQAQACERPAAMDHMAMAMSGNMPMHHAPAQPAPASEHHECIGCIAPLAIALYRPVSAPDFLAARHSPIRNSRDHDGETPAPEPPPPRTSA